MEIEVKARLKDKNGVEKKLIALGCSFSVPKTQDDTVWTAMVGSLKTFLSNDAFFRIRIQNCSKVILTAKRPKTKTGQASLVKHEYEVVVDSADEARGILKLMGLHEAVQVVKVRRTAKYKEYVICLDEVEKLGDFIEIEKFGEKESAQKTQNEMLGLLQELGIPPEDVVKKGYDIVMLEENPLLK
ncbi:class IV adenylate cyclase [Candidatus Uhrbacteria bacterium]|nr:class IV adenylate cyclase [Candidatus Uhrbacteria bacterium]